MIIFISNSYCGLVTWSRHQVAEDNKKLPLWSRKQNPNITKIFILHLFLKSYTLKFAKSTHNFLNIYFFYLAVLSLSCSMWTHVETCVILVPQQGSKTQALSFERTEFQPLTTREIPAHKFWNAFISSPLAIILAVQCICLCLHQVMTSQAQML